VHWFMFSGNVHTFIKPRSVATSVISDQFFFSSGRGLVVVSMTLEGDLNGACMEYEKNGSSYIKRDNILGHLSINAHLDCCVQISRCSVKMSMLVLLVGDGRSYFWTTCTFRSGTLSSLTVTYDSF